MKPTDRASCAEVVRRLDDYLDRELGVEDMARVRLHLRGCVDCAREARFERAVLEGVRAKLRRIQLPADLAAGIHRALQAASETHDP